jgi:tyrosyl-tRNA synthetase
MSKSLGNYIGIDERPREMFGKVMSIPDDLVLSYYQLTTDVTPAEFREIEKGMSGGANPRDLKIALAKRLITMYHSAGAARDAEEEFLRVFRGGGAPDSMPEVHLESKDGGLPIIQILSGADLVSSKSEARRMIRQKAVRVDGNRVEDENLVLAVRPEPYQVQVGKRSWARITVG